MKELRYIGKYKSFGEIVEIKDDKKADKLVESGEYEYAKCQNKGFTTSTKISKSKKDGKIRKSESSNTQSGSVSGDWD